MNDITIRAVKGIWTVRAGGAVLAETEHALELTEGDNTPIVFFPRGDIAMMFLEPSITRTPSAMLGEAAFFSVQTKSELIQDVAWSHEAPGDAAAEIAGHLAFDRDRVTVEEI